MKKILLFASALAGLFFAASCQQENLEPVAGGNTVTYTVQIPDAIGTKAVGDDVTNANVLHYEVYRTKNAETKIFSEEDNLLYHKAVEANDDGTFTIVLELINNQNFTVLLWAQYQESLKNGENLILENEAYNVENLTNVTINTPLKANQLDYAAFAGHHFIKANVKDTKKVIELHRPVAQLNIGTTAESLTAFNDPVVLKKSSVSVEGLSNTYNVATKAAGAVYNGAISYGVQPVLKKANDEYETFTVGTTTYPYVGMNYVGFAATEGSTIKVSYLIETSEGDITNTIENVPVKANYRTNIVGNLITSMTDYKVELDNAWFTPDENVEVVTVSTAAELVEAIKGASTTAGEETNIKLVGNIEFTTKVSTKANDENDLITAVIIPEGKSITLDLNGFDLTVPCNGNPDKHYYAFGVYGNLTVTDSSEEKKGSINARGNFNYGKMTLESGIINAIDANGGYGVRNYPGAEFIMNGGTIATTNEDGDIPGEGYDASPIRVDEGANAIINEGTITNISNYTCALDNYGETVVNGGTFTSIHTTIANSATLTIEGGSFTCNGLEGITAHALWAAEGTTTINGGTFDGKDNYNGFNVDASQDATVNITGGEFLPVHSGSLYGEGTINVTGGVFFDDPTARLVSGYAAENGPDGKWRIVECPVKVGASAYYATLSKAVEAVKEGETITILAGKTLEEGSIQLPPTLKNVTFAGEEGAVLKDMTISTPDGNSYSYEGLTFDGITFDNSRILLTGWRNGDETIKDLTVTNCVFKNLADNTNSAALHINKDAPEAVNGLTFTNNVIDGATGGSKSGIYAQVTGEVLVSGNVINNVAFRPYVIQVTTNDGVADNFVVTNNTFSGSASGRAQGLGNTAAGTDAVNVEVTENVFKGITSSQQICYWNFNPAKTTYDLSHNYYDIDIKENPGKIYFNSSAEDIYDLADMNVFPIYTNESKSETYSPEINAAKIGETEYATLQEAFNVGGEITLLCNVTVDETVVLAEDKTATLDLNGKSIISGYQSGSDSKHIYPIDNYGILNIIDKTQGGFIQGRGIYNRDAAKLTINQAKIFAEDWNGGACVWSFGTGEVYLNDATLIGNTGCVSSEGYLEINGGAYTCYSGINDNGEQITSPTYNIRAYNGLKITDGTFTSRHGVISIGGGEALLETGNFTINFAAKITSNVLYVYGDAQVTVNGGNYISDDSNNKADSGAAVVVSGSDAKVDIFGGTFIGMNGMVSGNTTLYGGTFNTVWDYNHYDNIKDKLAEGYDATQNADGSWTVAPSSTEN